MRLSPSEYVREAIVLAAGNGDRFITGPHISKLLRPVLGVPLIVRTLTSAVHAGIHRVVVVLGYQGDRVRRVVSANAPADLDVDFRFNPSWDRENGLSVLAARDAVDGRPFALLMGDHVFEPDALRRLLRTPRVDAESVLGVDCSAVPSHVAAEATRVVMDADRIVAIGKGLDPYSGLDTGLFVCGSPLFDALEGACAAGDTTLSGGIRGLARRRLVRGIDISDHIWCDVDTPEDLQAAEALLLAHHS